MKTALFVVAAILALSPTALASGGGLHLDLDETGEAHTIDVRFDEGGNVTFLIDGQPAQAPAAPEDPALPPEAPTVPETPTLPETPTAPEVPPVPTVPDVPETPEVPAIPDPTLPPLPDEDDIPGGV